MMVANTSVMALAATIGILEVNIPNNNQSNVPSANNEYINSDIPLVFFV